jgi:hypothetical protein
MNLQEEMPSTLVTSELRQTLNVWSEPLISHPVDRSDIRRWAIAVYWPDEPPRLFWDEDYAKTTRWGGIIAPREFNPFAWPAIRPTDRMPRSAIRAIGQRTMNGGQTETFAAPIRPGDVVMSASALVDLQEKVGRLGLTLFKYTQTRWTNQRKEIVKTRISISIQY